MGEELQTAKQILKNLDQMLLAIKATGGYYVRKDIPLSENRINKLCKESEPKIRKMVIRLVVAETMLQELPPSLHSRWDEYHRRLSDCIAHIMTVK